jgi:Tfp pilus assembly protein PilF
MSNRIDFIHSALDYLRAKRFEEASDICRKLLAADRSDLDARFFLGVALSARGIAGEAEHHLEKVVHARPDHVDAHRELAMLLEKTGKLKAAETEFRAVVRLQPRDPSARAALAACLLAAGQAQAAAQEIETILRAAPAFSPAHNLLGLTLVEQGRLDEAERKFRETILLEPANVGAHANLATTLVTLGRFDEGLASLTDALLLAPDDQTLNTLHATALLKAGGLAEGFAAHEWHRRGPGRDRLPPTMLLPRLATLGSIAGGSVAGRTIVVHHEPGFGDTLQFLRYAPLLQRAGARVVLWMQDELARLLRAQPGMSELYSTAITLPRFDYHCPVMSLPRVFGTILETIPAEVPYIQADPALIQAWAARLPPRPQGGCRAGLAWAGEPPAFDTEAAILDRKRSVTLGALAPLFAVPGAGFVSLQHGAAAHQADEQIRAGLIHDPMWGVTDFADTAAIIANLDVVVSVDTAVAHLAGAMGKPVMLLDRYDNCWRWLSGRADSPWYPTLRIFRQPQPGAWHTVALRAAASLEDFIARLTAQGRAV